MDQVINLLLNRKEVCLLVKQAFSPSFCVKLIEENRPNFKPVKTYYPSSYRNNERQLKDDVDLSNILFQQIKQFLPEEIIIDGISKEEKGEWVLLKLNSRIRICRYLPNQYFHKHLDGIHFESEQVQSKLTFMIYLNEANQFTGGRTLFFNSKNDDSVIATYSPEMGDLIIFDHNLWHSGEAVQEGEKYILRSDILYQRKEKLNPQNTGFFEEGHLGYIWVIIPFKHWIITSGRDKKIKIWTKDGKKIEELKGHKNSVLSLLKLNDQILISASRDQTIKIWRLENGHFQLIEELGFHKATVLCLCKIDDSQFLSGDADGKINLITSGGQLASSFQAHEEWVWDIKLLTDELYISVSEDGKIKIWNLEERNPIAEWQDMIPINTLAIDSVEQKIWIGRLDGCLLEFRFDLENKALFLEQKIKAHEGIIRCLTIDGNTLVSGGEDNKVVIWDKFQLHKIWEIEHDNFVQDVLVDQTAIISVSYDGRIRRNLKEIFPTNKLPA